SRSTTRAPIPFSAIRRMASTTGASGPMEYTSLPLTSSRCLTLRMAFTSYAFDPHRAYPRRGQPCVNKVERTLLGFHVEATEVFPDQAKRDELDPAQEQDHRHHRRPALHRVAEQQRLGDHPGAVAEGDQRGQQTQVGGQPQRRGREAGDAFQREVPQLPQVVLAAPGRTGLALVLDRDAVEADPA